MRISIVGSYHLAHGYLGAAEALRRRQHEVTFVPAQRYKSENPHNHVDLIIDDLRLQKPDIVLLWRAETLEPEELAKVKESCPARYALYSWDDPYSWEADKNLPKKCPYLEVAFSCCMSSLSSYTRNGALNAVYCPPGFDPSVHFYEENEEYKCDVSLVCSNLYNGNITKHHHLDRKVLLTRIIKGLPDKDVRLYGSSYFVNDFPQHYKGWLPFEESRLAFSNTAVNLCTHIRPDGFMYINERVCQILGSRGLLLVDHTNGLDNLMSIGEHCVVYQDDIVEQVKEILANKEKYDKVRIEGQKLALDKFTWASWADVVLAAL